MPFAWPNRPPADCPFPQSTAFRGRNLHRAPCALHQRRYLVSVVGVDDVLYTPWTDGCFAGERRLPVDCSSKASDASNAGRGGRSGTGNARILGNDPLHLSLENLGVEYASPAPYGGRYPCASLMHDGVWYYGTYCLDESGRTAADGRPLNWDILGPFVGFRMSRDGGKTWEETPHTPARPLFGESGKNGGKIRIGDPACRRFRAEHAAFAGRQSLSGGTWGRASGCRTGLDSWRSSLFVPGVPFA